MTANSSTSLFTINLIIVIIATAGAFASDSYLPALPVIAHALHSSTMVMQSTITSYLFGFSVAQPVYGLFSDRYGRRPILLVGFIIASIGSLICMFASHVTLLIIGRFIQGIGVAVGAAIFRSVLRDVFSGQRLAEAIANISTFFAIVPIIAPIVGAHLQTWFGWQANFIFLTIYSVLCWLLIYFFMQETNPYINPHAFHIKAIINNYRTLLTSKTFMGNVICSSLAFSLLIVYAAISPFLFQGILKLTPVQYSWLALYVGAGFLLGKFINRWLLTKISSVQILLIGILINLAAGMLLLATGYLNILSVNSIMFPVALSVGGCSFILANAGAGAFMPFPKIAGVAGGLYGCLQILGSAITGQIIALFAVHNQIPLGAAFTLLSVFSLITYFLLVSPYLGKKSKSTEEL